MADDPKSGNKGGAGSSGSSGDSAPADTEERYTPEQWRSRARSLGASPHAVAGALHDNAPNRTLTEAQVKDKLAKFLKREVEEA